MPKRYYFEYSGTLSAEGLERIRTGIVLGDGTECKPAEIILTGAVAEKFRRYGRR